ncbi:17206_t:CDS:2 [Acaulospora colombiana]|uniref:17206_t:CDS:1 n=1 Tax=Acaulospora colombiana TaxID=27376 RepID=A0ACA9LRM8_9GLOM|nr:17206_t:CDS:2 [Acaulospora colombiana]
MSQNENYEKYYQTALKKFTELSDPSTLPASSKLNHRNIKKVSPVIEELISNYSLSSSPPSSTPPSQTSRPIRKKKIESPRPNSPYDEIDWPDENDGWVYIKGSDDDLEHGEYGFSPKTYIIPRVFAKIPKAANKFSNVFSTYMSPNSGSGTSSSRKNEEEDTYLLL